VCPCVQYEVQLNVNDFQITDPIDPKILDKDRFLNGQHPLPREGVQFKYAASNMFPFKPISSEIACSEITCFRAVRRNLFKFNK
jgi:hypothetical protein